MWPRATSRLAQISGAADEVEGLARVFNTMTDAVERREARLRAQNQAMTVLATKKSLHDGDMDAAVRVVTETAADILKVSRSSIWLLSEDGTTLTCMDLYESAKRTHSSGTHLKTADYPAYFHALDQAPVLAARDAQTDSRTREFADLCLAPLGSRRLECLDSARRPGSGRDVPGAYRRTP